MHAIIYNLKVEARHRDTTKTTIKHSMLINNKKVLCGSQKAPVMFVINILHSDSHYCQSVQSAQTLDRATKADEEVSNESSRLFLVR